MTSSTRSFLTRSQASLVYVYDKPVEISELTLQQDEVDSVRWFDADYVLEKIEPPRDALFCVPKDGFSLILEWFSRNMENR